MSRGKESLWDIAVSQSNLKEDESKSADESTVLVVGSKNSGKTSIILRFLDRDEVTKPTTALEYTFGRRAKGHNIAKDVGHIWELGGGTWLSRLIDVPIGPDTLRSLALVIVLDLSRPQELWYTLEKLLKTAKSRIEQAILELKDSEPNIREILKKAAWERVGPDHMDKDMMDPFLIPLVIIGGKNDLFQDFDPTKKKIICKTLRFVAHTHGAALQFFSVKQESLMNKAKTAMNHLVFGTAASKTLQTDHNKPLLVPAGADSLEQIGSPPLADHDLGRLQAKTPLDLWKQAFVAEFPQEVLDNPITAEDPTKEQRFKESSIDSMRAQKDEELDRYRRQCERKNREAAQAAMSDGY